VRRPFAPLAGEAPAGDFHVLPLEGRLHLLDREPVGGEPVRVDRDLDLALALAHERDGPDILHALERALDPLVGQLRDLPRGPAGRDDQGQDGRRIDVELLETGASVPWGSCERIVATFSRTSCAAVSMSRSRMNETKTWPCPSIVIERSSSIPLMVLTTSSMRLVIWLSTSSGLAPGRWVVTVTVGMSTFGKMSKPRSR
jgi:hypothetical protein